MYVRGGIGKIAPPIVPKIQANISNSVTTLREKQNLK